VRIDLNRKEWRGRLLVVTFKVDGKFKRILQQLASYYDTDVSSLLRVIVYLWYKYDYPLSSEYTECMMWKGQGVTDFDNLEKIDDMCINETEYEEVEE